MEASALAVTALLGEGTGVVSKVFEAHPLHWADQMQASFLPPLPFFLFPFSFPQSSLGPAHLCPAQTDPSRPWANPTSFLEALEHPNTASETSSFPRKSLGEQNGACTQLRLSWEAGRQSRKCTNIRHNSKITLPTCSRRGASTWDYHIFLMVHLCSLSKLIHLSDLQSNAQRVDFWIVNIQPPSELLEFLLS